MHLMVHVLGLPSHADFLQGHLVRGLHDQTCSHHIPCDTVFVDVVQNAFANAQLGPMLRCSPSSCMVVQITCSLSQIEAPVLNLLQVTMGRTCRIEACKSKEY